MQAMGWGKEQTEDGLQKASPVTVSVVNPLL
jgi:hypothetical protein